MGGGGTSGDGDSDDGSGSGQDNRGPDDDGEAAGAQAAVDDYAHKAGVQQSPDDKEVSGESPDGKDPVESDSDNNDGGGARSGIDGGGLVNFGDGGSPMDREQFTDEPVPTDQGDDIATFAQDTFADGAIAERFRKEPPEQGVRATPAAESRPNRFGGWDEFDPDNILHRDDLNSTSEAAGVTSDFMQVADMKGENTPSFRAFITNYHMADSIKRVSWKQAHSQMATFTFLDSMGVRVPFHTFNADSEYVAAASVERIDRPEIISVSELRRKDRSEAAEFVNDADPEEFLDIAAAHMLAGNTDLHAENLKIGRDGSFHAYDLDRGGRRFGSMASMQADAGKARRVARNIRRNSERQDFDINKKDFADRAARIAYRLEETGRKEVIVERVRQYDRLFYDKSGESFASTFKHNIELAAADYRQNQL